MPGIPTLRSANCRHTNKHKKHYSCIIPVYRVCVHLLQSTQYLVFQSKEMTVGSTVITLTGPCLHRSVHVRNNASPSSGVTNGSPQVHITHTLSQIEDTHVLPAPFLPPFLSSKLGRMGSCNWSEISHTGRYHVVYGS